MLTRRWLAAVALAYAVAPLGATVLRAEPAGPTLQQAQPAQQAQQVDVTGVYQSNWNEVRLIQRGDTVTGTYVCCGGGTIEGRLTEGHVLRYRWKQPGAEGRGVWRVDGRDRLLGTWGVGQDDVSGGRWDLERSPQIAQ